MTTIVGTYFEYYIGSFMEYDASNNTNIWRKYMLIRVLINVRLPLKKDRKVKLQGGERSLVSLKYERLGVFCSLCGLLGHNDQICDHRFTIGTDNGVHNWSVELRAESRRTSSDGGGGSRWLRNYRVDFQPVNYGIPIPQDRDIPVAQSVNKRTN